MSLSNSLCFPVGHLVVKSRFTDPLYVFFLSLLLLLLLINCSVTLWCCCRHPCSLPQELLCQPAPRTDTKLHLSLSSHSLSFPASFPQALLQGKQQLPHFCKLLLLRQLSHLSRHLPTGKHFWLPHLASLPGTSSDYCLALLGLLSTQSPWN